MKEYIPASALAEVAIRAAHEAGQLLKKGFGSVFKTKTKPGISNFVTEFDEASEHIIKSMIKQHFPAHGFIGEESEEVQSSTSDVIWVVDPLDGTHNFSRSIPIFAVSIAAVQKGVPLVGVIYQPITEELFVAEKDRGSFLCGEKLQVSDKTNLREGFLATGLPYNLEKNPERCIDTYIHFLKEGHHIREIGSAALCLSYLAAGRFDVFWEPVLESWDVAAGMLLVQEAGGSITHYDGSAYDLFAKKTILATNGHLHNAMRQKLQCR